MSKTFEETLAQLRKPFPLESIEWKPQKFVDNGAAAIAAAFVDPRRYQDRLDEADPSWTVDYTLLTPEGTLVRCDLIVGGVRRVEFGEKTEDETGSDSGAGRNTLTSSLAQAFKRACTTFGLGRDLYYLPSVKAPLNQYKRFTVQPTLPAWYLEKCGAKGVAKPSAMPTTEAKATPAAPAPLGPPAANPPETQAVPPLPPFKTKGDKLTWIAMQYRALGWHPTQVRNHLLKHFKVTGASAMENGQVDEEIMLLQNEAALSKVQTPLPKDTTVPVGDDGDIPF